MGAGARTRRRPAAVAPAAAPKPAPAPKAGATPSSRFRGRDGYRADFLGDGPLAVPLPGLGPRAADVAPVSDDPCGVLKYRHFSVIQSASRRLPMLTAVNIDGARSVALKRKDDWRLDGRLSADHQIGNELYASNPLDRGHMVRRNDPGWGTKSQAAQGENDTFHYTNSTPQHERLNQREWVGLEDYVLQNARTRGFRACVFTGPVFRDDDRRLKAQPGAQDVPIPEEFWKIAAMVNDDTGELSVTGYVLSHGPLIRDLVEAAFVYGEYKTYQVRIDRIEAATGFDFGALRDQDPLAAPGMNETLFGEAAIPIGGPGDLRL
jgi:endonuclease G